MERQPFQVNQQTVMVVMGNRINNLIQENVYLEARCMDLEQRVAELELQLKDKADQE